MIVILILALVAIVIIRLLLIVLIIWSVSSQTRYIHKSFCNVWLSPLPTNNSQHVSGTAAALFFDLNGSLRYRVRHNDELMLKLQQLGVDPMTRRWIRLHGMYYIPVITLCDSPASAIETLQAQADTARLWSEKQPHAYPHQQDNSPIIHPQRTTGAHTIQL